MPGRLDNDRGDGETPGLFCCPLPEGVSSTCASAGIPAEFRVQAWRADSVKAWSICKHFDRPKDGSKAGKTDNGIQDFRGHSSFRMCNPLRRVLFSRISIPDFLRPAFREGCHPNRYETETLAANCFLNLVAFISFIRFVECISIARHVTCDLNWVHQSRLRLRFRVTFFCRSS